MTAAEQGSMVKQPVTASRVEVFAARAEVAAEEVNARIAEVQDRGIWADGRVDVVPVDGVAIVTLHWLEIISVNVIDTRTGRVIRTETPAGLQVMNA